MSAHNGGQHLIEDHIQWNMKFNGRQLLRENNILGENETQLKTNCTVTIHTRC